MNTAKRFRLPLILLLTLIPFFHTKAAIPEVSVLIGKSLRKVEIKGNNLTRKFAHHKNKRTYKGLRTVVFNCNAKNNKLNQEMLVATLKTDNNLIKWDENLYEGQLMLTSNPGSKSCDLIMKTPMDRYISKLLTKEMNAHWPIEALKAQAVAARTYAFHRLKNKNRHRSPYFQLENSEKDQVNGTVKDESKKTREAATKTKGEILVHSSGELQPIFYHAKCGGKTLLPSQVWGGHIAGYKSVSCPFCYHHGKKKWKKKININKFSNLLKDMYVKQFGSSFYNQAFKKDGPIYAFNDHPFNRTGKIYYSGKTQNYSKPLLRKIAGRRLIPSNNYSISIQEKEVTIEGSGLGHGVGLCQLGALELAKRGYTYKDILSYYFPNHKIANIYKDKYY